MDHIITILPVVTKDLPISPRFTPYDFLSRCKLSTLTTRQPMVEFYLLTFPRFPLRKKEHKPYFAKNRTHDFRTSRCAGYLLDHSGDDSTRRIQPTLFHDFLDSFTSTPPLPSFVVLSLNHRWKKPPTQPYCAPDRPWITRCSCRWTYLDILECNRER